MSEHHTPHSHEIPVSDEQVRPVMQAAASLLDGITPDPTGMLEAADPALGYREVIFPTGSGREVDVTEDNNSDYRRVRVRNIHTVFEGQRFKVENIEELSMTEIDEVFGHDYGRSPLFNDGGVRLGDGQLGVLRRALSVGPNPELSSALREYDRLAESSSKDVLTEARLDNLQHILSQVDMSKREVVYGYPFNPEDLLG